VLYEIADRYPVSVVTQPNSGLPAARNFGIALAGGRYVLPFDADDVAEPELVERCVEALEAAPGAAYVATWSRFMHEDGRVVDDGYQPLGNWSDLVREQNVAGAAASLLRRELFDQGFGYDTEFPSYEDWYLLRQLHEAGLYGVVLPQRLFRYRVRADSMLRVIGDPDSRRFREEMDTRLREREMDWVATSAER
jgi:glycogen synthase